MSPPTAGKPAAWAHQDALVLAVKRLLHGEATLDSLDAYVTLALQEPRVAYKALCGCVTHHLLVKVKRRQHRLTLLQLLSKVCEQATAALGPHNVFGAHAHVAPSLWARTHSPLRTGASGALQARRGTLRGLHV
jgi:hypothetical protein